MKITSVEGSIVSRLVSHCESGWECAPAIWLRTNSSASRISTRMAACESTRWRASMGDNSIKLVVIKRPSFRRAKQIGQCGGHLQRSGVADPIIDALPHSACGNDFLLAHDGQMLRQCRLEIGRASCRERVCQYGKI